MARYFFVVEAPVRTDDRVGMNREGLDQIKHEALRRAADFASDIGNLEQPGAIVAAVREGSGGIVMTVSLVCSVAVHHRT